MTLFPTQGGAVGVHGAVVALEECAGLCGTVVAYRYRVQVLSISYSSLSDEELVRRVAAREEGALAVLHGRHRAAALALARTVLFDAALAEDAVQEAFFSAWRQADRYREERAPARAWLLMLVRRRAIDILRRELRRRAHGAETVPGTAPPAAEEAWIRVRRDRVRAALAGLSPSQRELLGLAYYAGLSQREIAQHLGQPLGTVKSRTFGALGQLRGALEPL
jgi:RNA polymerase sigma-70 factor, ECF subfamily